MKLWDKGFDTDRFTERFTVGRDRELDTLLARADILGNIAHARGLRAIGLLSGEETRALVDALRLLHRSVEAGDFSMGPEVEDIHSRVEFFLAGRLGDPGKKIHAGRSRNDQVLLDLKLFTRDRLFSLLDRVEALFELLLARAGEGKDILLPGYTHLQVAMPSSFGLWFGGYAESLAEDLVLLKAARDVVNTNPLGTGAGYGSSIPLDRALVTRLLAFDDLAYNPVHAQMQRGKMEQTVLFALSRVALTVGRLAADVCLFTSPNFGFLSLPDRFTTGSSIMPHKKNPDVFELVRARCNRLQALPGQVGMIAANLTSGYFRDMQLVKEVYLPAFAELDDCLFMTTLVLGEAALARDLLEDDRYRYLFTVEEVNRAVAAGVPFREAYRAVGERVQRGEFVVTDRRVHHVHEGSIGNLCLDRVRAKFDRGKEGWNVEATRAAERDLLEASVD
ncbi:MAG: argininosuccinate lyase [Odoribacteraceae bacterium]|jgi:argininosuccinate lyase|nr:argininosuccinate lyase [Odoribacteraceae bacterium]